jgi:hypothetical protein
MNDDLQQMARLKLKKLLPELGRSVEIIAGYASLNLQQDEAEALALLNDRAAIYLSDVTAMLATPEPLNISATLDLIALIEMFVAEVDKLDESA